MNPNSSTSALNTQVPSPSPPLFSSHPVHSNALYFTIIQLVPFSSPSLLSNIPHFLSSLLILNSAIQSAIAFLPFHYFCLLQIPLTFSVAPKKESAPKKEKETPAPKPKESPKKKEPEAEEEDDTPKEKAPKHPLAALPPTSIPIDEWKRQYSNNDTDVALKWFWEHYDPKEYSLWRVDYKVRIFPHESYYQCPNRFMSYPIIPYVSLTIFHFHCFLSLIPPLFHFPLLQTCTNDIVPRRPRSNLPNIQPHHRLLHPPRSLPQIPLRLSPRSRREQQRRHLRCIYGPR